MHVPDGYRASNQVPHAGESIITHIIREAYQ